MTPFKYGRYLRYEFEHIITDTIGLEPNGMTVLAPVYTSVIDNPHLPVSL